MRGKTKIGTSALMLSVILMALAIVPASANPTATLELPSIVNPLLEPGDTITIDIVIDDVEKLWSFEFEIYYDTSVLTCIDYAPVRANPVAMINPLPSGINDEDGYMWMGATRKVDDTDGFTTEDPTLMALVTFSVDQRGESALVIYNIELTDIYGSTLDAIGIDGYFNNMLQGYMMAPKIIDTSMTPGSHLDVYISVREVTKLWGVQFILKVDSNVLQPVDLDWEGLYPLDETEPGLCEAGPNYFRIAFHSFFGDEVGLTTFDPYAVVRLGFTVVGSGVTLLDLQDTKMADVDGNKLIHGVEDGSFANTYDVAVALDTGFVEDSNYQLSADPDGLLTLTGQIKNVAKITTARVEFTVQTAGGIPLVTLYSGTVSMTMSGQVRLSADLDASGLYGLYDVAFRVQYLDPTGAWVSGQKGSPSANRSTMIKHFTVEP